MNTSPIKQMFERIDLALIQWSRNELRRIGDCEGWANGNGREPILDGAETYERLDKIIKQVLRPKFREVIYIEYISPAEMIKEKLKLYKPNREPPRNRSGYAEYYGAFYGAMAVLDAFRPVWDGDYDKKQRDAQHHAERIEIAERIIKWI